jgi:hypothetical protein
MQLEMVESELSPGSVVSFYFDGRIRRAPYTARVKADIEKIISETGEAVVGILGNDGLHIEAQIIVGSEDLADFTQDLQASSEVFCGVFPGRDNDGVRAVTITLPDNDWIGGPHPH